LYAFSARTVAHALANREEGKGRNAKVCAYVFMCARAGARAEGRREGRDREREGGWKRRKGADRKGAREEGRRGGMREEGRKGGEERRGVREEGYNRSERGGP